MKAIDKIRLILGEEDFERFNYYRITLERLIPERTEVDLIDSFRWCKTMEGFDYWYEIHQKVKNKWNTIEDTIIYPRTISAEEHDEIFKMFVLAYYGFIKIDEYSVTRFFEENSIMERLYDALRSEE